MPILVQEELYVSMKIFLRMLTFNKYGILAALCKSEMINDEFLSIRLCGHLMLNRTHTQAQNDHFLIV